MENNYERFAALRAEMLAIPLEPVPVRREVRDPDEPISLMLQLTDVLQALSRQIYRMVSDEQHPIVPVTSRPAPSDAY